ncbi:hypothetical protein [Nitrosopumilus sp.]|uniref:hypothetical protein n=1 Tax=Nitrosopumilus sp. TaxID=2024843 RepID=UPI003D0CC921
MKYNYSNQDLLKNPEKYSFSKFGGYEFLESYFLSRKEWIQKIEYLLKDNLSLSDIIHYFCDIEIDKNEEEIILENFLAKLLCKKINENKINLKIDNFIKKFEIKKKLFTTYDLSLIEKSKDHKNLRNYLLLTFLCLNKYDETNNLKYLNTSLKINDLSISQIKNINEQMDLFLLKTNLENELKFIQEICHQKGLEV